MGAGEGLGVQAAQRAASHPAAMSRRNVWSIYTATAPDRRALPQGAHLALQAAQKRGPAASHRLQDVARRPSDLSPESQVPGQRRVNELPPAVRRSTPPAGARCPQAIQVGHLGPASAASPVHTHRNVGVSPSMQSDGDPSHQHTRRHARESPLMNSPRIRAGPARRGFRAAHRPDRARKLRAGSGSGIGGSGRCFSTGPPQQAQGPLFSLAGAQGSSGGANAGHGVSAVAHAAQPGQVTSATRIPDPSQIRCGPTRASHSANASRLHAWQPRGPMAASGCSSHGSGGASQIGQPSGSVTPWSRSAVIGPPA